MLRMLMATLKCWVKFFKRILTVQAVQVENKIMKCQNNKIVIYVIELREVELFDTS